MSTIQIISTRSPFSLAGLVEAALPRRAPGVPVLRTTRCMPWRLAVVSAALALAGIGAAHAQAAINQNAALAGSVTPGDTAGFPVTISKPGSYKLTGNLVVADPLKGAFVINAPNVSIDLNGFTISGPTTCSMPGGGGVTCTFSPGAPGIDHSPEGTGTVIRNGTVRGFGGGGVWVGDNSRVEDLRVEHNGYVGLVMTGAGKVHNVNAYFNLNHGILAYDSVVEASISRGNGGSGFYLANSLLIASKADRNKLYGVTLSGGGGAAGVRESIVSGNGVGALSSFVKSMGNNLCDGVAC